MRPAPPARLASCTCGASAHTPGTGDTPCIATRTLPAMREHNLATASCARPRVRTPATVWHGAALWLTAAASCCGALPTRRRYLGHPLVFLNLLYLVVVDVGFYIIYLVQNSACHQQPDTVPTLRARQPPFPALHLPPAPFFAIFIRTRPHTRAFQLTHTRARTCQYTHTHTHTRARARAHTRAHTHTLSMTHHDLPRAPHGHARRHLRATLRDHTTWHAGTWLIDPHWQLIPMSIATFWFTHPDATDPADTEKHPRAAIALGLV